MPEDLNERGFVVKKWKNRVPVCVVYPDSYYIGMSNLAIHQLYKTLNGIEKVVCERAFFEKDRKIFSLESKKDLTSFEILFFSISYELSYLNIAPILIGSGIPLRRKERKEEDPILVGGGITLIANPEPLAEFFDLFILGDIEATIPDFMECYLKVREKKRKSVIEELSSFSWVYNPSFLSVSYKEDGTVSSFHPANFKVRVKYKKGGTLARSAILCEKTEFSNIYLIEGTRGCPSRCPFCLMGNVYGFRVDKGSISLALKENVSDVGIIGGGVLFMPEILSLIRDLKRGGKRVHLPSLRIDKIPYELIRDIKDDIKTLTFGIEAASSHLRAALGKPISEDEILERIERILEIESFNFKLYFMIGLPGEKKEDVEAIFELAKKIRHVLVKKMAPRGYISRLTIHVSPFVPKPRTPLQWVKMENPVVLEEKVKWLKNKFSKLGGTVFTHESVKYSFLQGVLARGDRRLSGILESICEGRSIGRLFWEGPLNLGFYSLRERGEDEIFPWDFIEGLRKKAELYEEFKRYLSLLKI